MKRLLFSLAVLAGSVFVSNQVMAQPESGAKIEFEKS